MKAIKRIRQSTTSECGWASLALTATSQGRFTSLEEARRKFPVGTSGMTWATLTGMAPALGLTARAVRVALNHLAGLNMDARHHSLQRALLHAGAAIRHEIDPKCFVA